MMGREVRRVPPGWQHPVYRAGEVDGAGRYHPRDGTYRPLCDQAYEEAVQEWIAGQAAFVRRYLTTRKVPGAIFETAAAFEEAQRNPWRAYVEFEGPPPDPAYYRSRWAVTPTAYQVYETVSEGTPVSPVLLTREDLITWCQADHPDWHALSRQVAERFVAEGMAFSMTIMVDADGTPTMYEGAPMFEVLGPSAAADAPAPPPAPEEPS